MLHQHKYERCDDGGGWKIKITIEPDVELPLNMQAVTINLTLEVVINMPRINITGDNARVNLNSVDNSSNSVAHNEQSLKVFGEQFEELRTKLWEKARNPEQQSALGAVMQAEAAAKGGDRSKMHTALSTIGSAATWLLDGAKEIGVSVAAEAIKKSIQ